MWEQNPSSKSLAELAHAHGSDKTINCPSYEAYLAPLRDKSINLFEIGVGGYSNPSEGGASVRMWKSYFAKGKIYALDFYNKAPHNESRIIIFQGSQDDAALLEEICDKMGDLDVIVDDGSHRSEHVIKSFSLLFPRLKSGGIYIIEDIGTSYWPDHGGSTDLKADHTSMAYFKRIVDGMHHWAMKINYNPSYIESNVEFIHFFSNFIVVRKK